MNQRISWLLKERHSGLRTETVSSIGLTLSYPERECDLHIHLAQPLDGRTPEEDFALAEFRRLRDALDHILSEQSQ